jgi:hypothetical protein
MEAIGQLSVEDSLDGICHCADLLVGATAAPC